MNKLDKYKIDFYFADLQMHTNYTDGSASIQEMIDSAHVKKLKMIAITEHVRKQITYNYNDFFNKVKQSNHHGLIVLAGCETKILNKEGDLDITDEIKQKSELILGSVHGWNDTVENCIKGIKLMLQRNEIDIWAHPLAWANKKDIHISLDIWEELVKEAKKNDIAIEFNSKYDNLTEEQKEIVKKNGGRIVYGSDAHSPQDIRDLK